MWQGKKKGRKGRKGKEGVRADIDKMVKEMRDGSKTNRSDTRVVRWVFSQSEKPMG
jgi:hypothetical protein